jgi:hypothetical protein
MRISERMRRGVLAGLAGGLALGSGLGVAEAADNLPPAIEQLGVAPAARSPSRFAASLGVRTALFRSSGYDPFSTSDAFTETSVAASATVLRIGRLSTSVGGIFGGGSAAAAARGTRAALSLTRAGVSLEESFAVHPRGRVFARVVPAWLWGDATLTDDTLPAPLGTSLSTVTVDGSLGVAGRLNPLSSVLGLWLVAESGYGWAPAQHLTLAPRLPAPDRDKAGTTTLADVAPRGVFFRFAFAVTY